MIRRIGKLPAYFIAVGLASSALVSCASSAGLHSKDYYETALVSKYPGSDFRRIDEAIRNAPKIAGISKADLVKYIKTVSRNEWESVRACYSWVCLNIAYDTGRLYSGFLKDDRKDVTFYDRKGLCSGYASLFSDLLGALGIENEIVIGETHPSRMNARSAISGHAWNAAKVDGNWRLFDTTWGAGAISPAGIFSFRFNEYYFDVPPEELIFTHYPNDSRWQLAGQSVSKEEFTDFPYVDAKLFGAGVPASVLREAISSAPIKSSVLFYESPLWADSRLRLFDFPVSRDLIAEREYRFSLALPSDKIMVKDDDTGAILGTFGPQNGRFDFSLSFRDSGPVTFYYRSNDHYVGFIRYRVE